MLPTTSSSDPPPEVTLPAATPLPAWHRPQAFFRKVGRRLRLLKDDPEKFGLNLLQFSNPARFQDKLLDVQRAPRLHVHVDASLRAVPALNVLQPVLTPSVMTGGPNTVVNLALWIARQGVPVRIVTATAMSEADLRWFWQHLRSLTRQAHPPTTLSVASAASSGEPLAIGPCDMFMATHWSTAQQVMALHKQLQPQLEITPFFYLIQDFEPGFYAWSSNYALALETYDMDHIGVFNQSALRDYLVAQGAGRYADRAFAARSLVFEPAVDRANFYPPSRTLPPRTGLRRLLFYARASNPRNMLGLGLAALRRAVAYPLFQQDHWEFLAIGGNNSLPSLSLGSGQVLEPAPWADYRAYGELLRNSDVLLCPMLSPHTSYPVLEMAACGGLSVTNVFGTKTASCLAAISNNILAAQPTEEGLADALVRAALRVRHGVDRHAGIALPDDWQSALQPTAQGVAQYFRRAQP